jgi:alginate O-acetyltransferase complex protein AlgI
MLLGGLWHGAAWTYVVWGGLHGLFLVGERFMKQALGEFALWKSRPGRLFLGVLTYALVNITWVFFRAHDFPNAWRVLGAMLGLGEDGKAVLTTWLIVSAVVPVTAMLAIHAYMRERDLHVEVARWPVALVGLVLGMMLFLIAATQGGSSAFIYFQF